ncbi:hypothetical protein PUNSTDRAFT_144164 [Punctularia strigosozonata HHB-11173 SS5]|uniref:uncharacterized protein n=1 Tax=Punctularia strigosozonata (strain HHB-11173) TaxID=741275 RepID=UPI00044181F0|nr:uncharacterized protein PUNSTDRAFT_144164 [Punctularia strigosozonata HHB-11173 SS5]EIN08687.1 hypothetical protein PUNSTDRAFT_144164 [Punctularia strigosozonata HHB-11173 SS5]
MSLVTTGSSTAKTPPSLLDAIARSTDKWQEDLETLFQHASERFPDVVWELQPEGDEGGPVEEVWGHKAIVYARAPPSFQARYFSFRPAPISSPTPQPYSSSPPPYPQLSTPSLALSVHHNLGGSLAIDYPSRSPSPGYASGHGLNASVGHLPRSHSPAPSQRTIATTMTTVGVLTRFPTTMNPTLFAHELEYLYTGKNFGAAFEFLFDAADAKSPDADTDELTAEESRVDKLRKDLVFMWRSRLYSDIRIALTGSFSSANHETSTAIFSSHRFMLVSRSPYFYTALLKWGDGKPVPVSTPPKSLASSVASTSAEREREREKEIQTLTLPSPPFTPASLHFTLGYIYTGTLIFSHRTYDLDTAFHILLSALYLQLDALHDEIQARIVQEMMHGLFHAFLEFSEYERVTGGKWGVGGCRCRQCARRAPRVLEFAVRDDVGNKYLERGARRALVGLFGDGWCNAEFAALSQGTRGGVLKGVGKRTLPMNVFPLLWAANSGLDKVGKVIEDWADTVRDMLEKARSVVDECLCKDAVQCFEQPEWVEIVDADGVRFEDAERVAMVMDACRRGLSESNAGVLYQALVSSILLRVNDQGETVVSATSHVRVQVEQLRTDVLRWLRKRWFGVRDQGGFDSLESWAVKEISDEIDVPVEELLNPDHQIKGPARTTRPQTRGDFDGESMRSIPRSVASRNIASPTPGRNGALSPTGGRTAPSVHSIARSTMSTKSRAITSTAPARRNVSGGRTSIAPPPGPRPDSKLTPAASSSSLASRDSKVTSPSTARKASSRTPTAASVRSSAASFTSVVSTASTVRTSRAGPSTLKPPPSDSSRPNSTMSTASAGSTEFKTASEITTSLGTQSAVVPTSPLLSPRNRRISTASTASAASARSPGLAPPRNTTRRTSTASTASAASVRSTRVGAAPETPKLKSPSQASIRSNVSTTSTAARSTQSRRTVDRKSTVAETPAKITGKARATTGAGGTIKPTKSTSTLPPTPPETASSASTPSLGDGSLKRKASNDTIKESSVVTQRAVSALSPPGDTLDVGIPCIIASKRARFRAYARYIGEVKGETGPWVGVEVPVNDSWPTDKLEGRQWHDGTWGGIRYFDLGTESQWDGYGDQTTASRRRAVDWKQTVMNRSLKRGGAELSVDRSKRMRSVSPAISDVSNQESRGLFVRPQQVLYVVDAVGTDL